ncbi:hypothetical protein Glove_155g6 [Diversispora epigaea]|uniref:Protein kinase domain-containing protein n=1 Tax=Diversispora epigaea TaxID=1348612 RepID=A0A397J154_9GLOM|nr:hypothetical protein Glove_155g6 [Diversispora epigaea]
MKYCPAGHSSMDWAYSDSKNFIYSENCSLCTKERFIQEFKTWSSGNANIDEIIQESQINYRYDKLYWIPYDNFQNLEHIADGCHGSVYSAKLENGIKWNWNFIKRDWEYYSVGVKVALKEIKDSRYDIVKFLKMKKIVNNNEFIAIAKYFGFSKNPSTQNYIFVMNLYDDLHDFLSRNYLDLGWETKIDILCSMACGLGSLHAKNIVHCNFHSGNILVNYNFYILAAFSIDLDSCKLENDLILNFDHKNNETYGSIPYIPPEVLRGNEFTREGDIYSFGGIMYGIVAAQRPFSDQAHDTYLMIDICNGVRPKVPDFMLNWIPEWYLNLMYRCWSDDPSKRPTSIELSNLFREITEKLYANVMDTNVMRQLKISDENQRNTSKSQKQEFFEIFSNSNKLHPQSSYTGRYIHTLHGFHDLLEEIKSGKSPDPNLLFKFNESTISTHSIDGETEIQSEQKNVIQTCIVS